MEITINKWIYRVFYVASMLSLVNYIYVMVGLFQAEGWGIIAWAGAIRFTFYFGAVIALIGVILLIVNINKNRPIMFIAMYALLGSMGFIHFGMGKLIG